jgi:hypothetical protein
MGALLLTPEEAAQMAGVDFAGQSRQPIDENIILTAQLALLQPALGPLYDALTEERYQQLADNLLKLPLALWVKALLLQTNAVRLGGIGVTRQSADYIKPASERDIAMAVNALRFQARILLRAAIAHIDRNRNDYPEYEPIPHRYLRRIEGGIII